VPPAASARKRWLLAAVFAGLVVALYADPLFFRRNYGGRDLIAYNLPMEKSIHDAWARGTLPVWTPEVSGGRPLAPNPNVGAFYPVRILLSRVPFPLAMRIYPVVHWMAAGIGMLVLLAALGRSRAAAWVGAVTYAFSGVGVAEAFFPHILPGLTLLPWIVWAAARRSGSGAARLLVLSAFFALDFLAADIFTIALAIGCVGLWIALEEDASRRFGTAGSAGLAVALGALAAAPQIVATVLWIPLTNRAILGIKLADSVFFSIHPWRLLEFVVPYPFGGSWEMSAGAMWGAPIYRGRAMGIFPTLYCGAFAVIAAGLAWKSRDRGARFARVLLVVAVAVAVLPSLLPVSWAAMSSPLPLRNPEKLAVAIAFALALLSAIAFDGWRARPRRLGGMIAIGVLLAAAASAAALFPQEAGRLAVGAIGGEAGRPATIAASRLAGALAEGGLLWMATVVALDGLGRERRRRGLAAAVVLLTFVPIAANRKIAKTFREEDVLAPTAFARYVARHDPAGEYRTLGEALFRGTSKLEFEQNGGALSDSEFSRRAWYQHTPVLWSRGTIFNEDFDAGDLSRVESLRRVSGMASGFLDADVFFGAVSLKWGIRFRDQTPVPGYHPIGGDSLQVWDEHVRAFPDIRLLGGWLEAEGALPALHSISQLRAGEAVVESGAARRGAARPGQWRVLERTPERLVVDVEALDPGWLFVLRAWWPYRSVRVDGRPVEAVPAQLAFSAVPISAGRHRVEWDERLPGFELSRLGPILFGMIVAGLLVSRSRRKS
jgi:hypothetical protein